LFTGLFGNFSLGRLLQFNPSAARFRKADGDGLFGGGGAVLSFPNVVHFLTYEFTSLGVRGFSFARIFLSSFYRLPIRHKVLPR
jgi:hypothetical protein